MNPEEFEEFKKTFGEDFATHVADSVKGTSVGDFLPKINEWRKWEYGRQYNFYATDADKCPRRLFYMMWNIPESNPDITDQAINNFALGDMVEEHIIRKYRQLHGTMWEQGRCGFNLLDDPDFRKEIEGLNSGANAYGVGVLDMFMPRISGKMDIVFDDIGKVFDKKAKRYIIEVKSIKDWPFATHTRKGEDDPYMIGLDMVTPRGYYLQLCNYLYVNQVQDGMLHFFNKNNGAERIWHVTLEAATRAMEEVVLPFFKDLYISYLKRELPDPPCVVKISKDGSRVLKTGSDWRALYCPYCSQCWLLDGITEQPEFGACKHGEGPKKEAKAPKTRTKTKPSRRRIRRRTKEEK